MPGLGMLSKCGEPDLETIWSIINDAAAAYRDVIPADRLADPYMSRDELRHEVEDGVVFHGYRLEGALVGVMGIQDVEDVTLIRHAYVRTGNQKQGIGAALLAHLRRLTARPVLIGTWADAAWAIQFYRRHGFELVNEGEKTQLLKRYWTVPDRQIETSVVLADERWRERQPASKT